MIIQERRRLYTTMTVYVKYLGKRYKLVHVFYDRKARKIRMNQDHLGGRVGAIKIDK